jgi:hypothetical protein
MHIISAMRSSLRAALARLAVLGAVWQLMLVEALRRAPPKRAERQGWKRAD